MTEFDLLAEEIPKEETPKEAPSEPQAPRSEDVEAVEAGSNGKTEAPILIEGADAAKANGGGPLELEDSDDEMEVSGAMAEMLLPPNLLSEDGQEFADEAVSIDGDDSLKDKPPFPPFPPRNFEPPSDARKRVLGR